MQTRIADTASEHSVCIFANQGGKIAKHKFMMVAGHYRNLGSALEVLSRAFRGFGL